MTQKHLPFAIGPITGCFEKNVTIRLLWTRFTNMQFLASNLVPRNLTGTLFETLSGDSLARLLHPSYKREDVKVH
jgi:hypothetical protein